MITSAFWKLLRTTQDSIPSFFKNFVLQKSVEKFCRFFQRWCENSCEQNFESIFRKTLGRCYFFSQSFVFSFLFPFKCSKKVCSFSMKKLLTESNLVNLFIFKFFHSAPVKRIFWNIHNSYFSGHLTRMGNL